MTLIQPLHTVVIPIIDPPSVFNKANVVDLRSQYVGHVGHYWGAANVKYNGGSAPGDTFGLQNIYTEQWRPEITGLISVSYPQCIRVLTGVHGNLWGDVTETHVKEDEFIVSNTDNFYVPDYTFFPDGALCWPEPPDTPNDLNGNGETYAGTPGKPFVIRQRGTKLWVQSLTSVGWTGGAGEWRYAYGSTIRVWDISTDITPWDDAYSGGSMRGPKPETRFERCDFDLWGIGFGTGIESYACAIPWTPAHMIGVGERLMMHIDDETFLTTGWPASSFKIVTVNPYTGDVSYIWDGITAGTYNSAIDYEYPGWVDIRDGLPMANFVIPKRVAPRDAPWCVGQHLDHSDLWVGQYRCQDIQPTNTGGHYDDLGNQEWDLSNSTARPDLATANATPWQERTWDDPIESKEQIREASHIEIRDYDRLPANEHRGAIDAVCWHEGWRIWKMCRDSTGQGSYVANMDDYKTRSSVFTDAPPISTGAYIWIRRQSLDPLDSNGYRPNSEYETIDIFQKHAPPYSGYQWTPLALTITPYGDVVYLLLSNNSDNLDTFPYGRRWKIVRPNYWEINTRKPVINPNYDTWGRLPGWSNTDSNWYGDLLPEGSGEWMGYASQRCSVKMTCNEHWLYLANFPARATPTFDLRDPSIDITNGDVPNPANMIEDSFQSPLGFQEDGYDLGSNVTNKWFEPQANLLHYKSNIFWEWSIDLNTGQIRIPWRTQYNNADLCYGQHSLYGASYNTHFEGSQTMDWDIDDDRYDIAHQNRACYAATDTIQKVTGVTPTPTFH